MEGRKIWGSSINIRQDFLNQKNLSLGLTTFKSTGVRLVVFSPVPGTPMQFNTFFLSSSPIGASVKLLTVFKVDPTFCMRRACRSRQVRRAERSRGLS